MINGYPYHLVKTLEKGSLELLEIEVEMKGTYGAVLRVTMVRSGAILDGPPYY